LLKTALNGRLLSSSEIVFALLDKWPFLEGRSSNITASFTGYVSILWSILSVPCLSLVTARFFLLLSLRLVLYFHILFQ